MAARRTFRVQALDRSARQGVHASLRYARATREKLGVNERDFAATALVSQGKYILLVGVDIRRNASVKQQLFDVSLPRPAPTRD